MPCMGQEHCIPDHFTYIVQKPDPLVAYYEAYRDAAHRRYLEFQGPSFFTVMQSIIAAHPTNIKVCLKEGTFALGAGAIAPIIGDGGHFTVKGLGRNLTIITGTGSSIFDAQDGVLTSGIAQIEDLRITHYAPDNAIGLDCSNVVPLMKNVLYDQVHGDAVNVTGVKLAPVQNSPHPYLRRVDVGGCAKGFHLQQDHALLLNCISGGESVYGFGEFSAAHILVLNPHVYVEDTEPNTIGYSFVTPGEDVTIINPYFEPHHAAHVGEMFHHNDGGNYVTHVYSPQIWWQAPNIANIPLSNNYAKIKFFNQRRRVATAENKLTMNEETLTGTGADQAVTHGLVTNPKHIVVTPTMTLTTVSGLSFNAGDDHFHVTVTLNKTCNWRAEI